MSLPQMIAGSTMDPESVGLVREYVTELMACVRSLSVSFSPLLLCSLGVYARFMMRERNRIFQKEYDSASLQYQNISRS